MIRQCSTRERITGSCDRARIMRVNTVRRSPSRPGLLLGCSLATLVAALGPVAAQSLPTRSPSTQGLSAADFRTWPAYQGDWGLGAINAAEAYARGFTGLDVPVAVVDSGIDPNHPKFTGRLAPESRNFWLTDPPGLLSSTILADVNGHGTHVSGTIGASPAGGQMMGVAYESRILSLNAIMDPNDSRKIDDLYLSLIHI